MNPYSTPTAPFPTALKNPSIELDPVAKLVLIAMLIIICQTLVALFFFQSNAIWFREKIAFATGGGGGDVTWNNLVRPATLKVWVYSNALPGFLLLMASVTLANYRKAAHRNASNFRRRQAAMWFVNLALPAQALFGVHQMMADTTQVFEELSPLYKHTPSIWRDIFLYTNQSALTWVWFAALLIDLLLLYLALPRKQASSSGPTP